MLQIFHAPRSRSMRVVWLAEEMGVPYELKIETIGQPSAAFLAANPLGAFPAIVDGEAAMGESTAILHYITERYGPTPLAPKLGHPRYADYVQFLVYGEGSMAAMLNPVLATLFRAPEDQRDNVTSDFAKAGFLRRVQALAPRLEKDEHLAGDFSAADISVGWALGLGAMLDLEKDYPPAVKAYQARLQARPAFQAAAAK